MERFVVFLGAFLDDSMELIGTNSELNFEAKNAPN
jgi:hypothetical protein